MELRNSTNRTLTIYLADKNQEEPEMVKVLLVGESVEIDDNMPEIISIQEQLKMQETKIYMQLRKKELVALNELMKSFTSNQFPLLHKYLDAKHLAYMELLETLPEK